jgi:hypothetical protein
MIMKKSFRRDDIGSRIRSMFSIFPWRSTVTSGSTAVPSPGEAGCPCCCCCRGLAHRSGLGLWHPLCLGGSLCPCGGSTSCCCWSSLGLSCSSLGSDTRSDQCAPDGLKGRHGRNGQSVRLCCSPLSRLTPASRVMWKQNQKTRFFSVSGFGLYTIYYTVNKGSRVSRLQPGCR